MSLSERHKFNSALSFPNHNCGTGRTHCILSGQTDFTEKENEWRLRPRMISFIWLRCLLVLTIAFLGESVFAATRYVWTNSPSPGTGFLTWSTAAHTIQDAVDVAVSNDMILVTNGVYDTGGIANYPEGSLLTNRVAIYKPVIVSSVNGPLWSMIAGGYRIRGVYMTNGAILSGFTITNGHTLSSADIDAEKEGGGIWCESTAATVSNCIFRKNVANGSGSGAICGTYYNCTFDQNGEIFVSYGSGGGVYGGILHDCILTDNYTSGAGGGACNSWLYNCNLKNNGAREGGGASISTLSNCNLANNWATYGGGASSSTVFNCFLKQNEASTGGGAYDCVLYSSALIENIGTQYSGGGARNSTLYNCTVIGNRMIADLEGYGPSVNQGGGVSWCDVFNSIVYYNMASAGANYETDGWGSSSFSNCCTWPLPFGEGNFTNAPGLAGIDNPRLIHNSPCINRGKGPAGGASDIDGQVRTNGPEVDVGCDELWVAAATGSLAAAISIWPITNTVADYPLQVKVQMQGQPLSYVINYGDGVSSTNEAVTVHAFKYAGTYNIVLRATNLSASIAVTTVVQVAALEISSRYVTTNGNDKSDGTSWSSAKATIQAAVDSAPPCGLVMVSNGIYASGGYSSLYSRVSITNAIRVHSVNGPEVTTIRGQGPLGDIGVMRCAYVADGCFLCGFTLTNGFTVASGNVYAQCGGAAKCDSSAGVISNCVLTTSAANLWGGGCYNGTLVNCSICNNIAADGGGVLFGTLRNCTISQNESYSLASGNIGGGGGANSALLINCSIQGNEGGGIISCLLNNCTVTRNHSKDSYGGVIWSDCHNSIVYFNTCDDESRANHFSSRFDYSCIIPIESGIGNITNNPLMASFSHLSVASPCVAKGSPSYSSGVDIDGSPWQNPPSIGCDEIGGGPITGGVTVVAMASPTNVGPGADVAFTGIIEGPTTSSVWEFADGTTISNQPAVIHAFSESGRYSVVLRAYNDTFLEGVEGRVDVQVDDCIYYVNADNETPEKPYASWGTAATNIQSAIDIAICGGVVLVTNGTYEIGSVGASRIALTNQVKVRSVNGPTVTIVKGQGPTGSEAVRCASIGPNCMLSGFTLIDGATYITGSYKEQSGGGAYCEPSGIVSNCVIVSNTAWRMGGGVAGEGIVVNSLLRGNIARVGDGGGAYSNLLKNCSIVGNTSGQDGGGTYCSLLQNCLLVGNYAGDWGGGCAYGALVNCTVVSNTGDYGGGTAYGTLTNCIVFFNCSSLGSSYRYGSNYYYSTMQFSCAAPLAAGYGNTSANPMFVNLLNNDYRLTGTSSCINAGTNQSWMADVFDLNGKSRIWGGQVDMGAYEYQGGLCPVILDDANVGVVSNRFGFNINWTSGRVVVVDASTNLTQTNWIPLATGTLTGGPYYFFDSKWTNYIGRFYRIRSQP